jgi:cytochrome c biogenesis protein CcmG, thiol:disulfide interchange protein DsbE
MRRLLAPVPLAVIGVVVAIVALLAYGLASNEPDTGIEEALQQGEREPAPELELPLLSGDGEGSLQEYRGQVVVLNFWASWCYPACYEEAPVLEQGWRTYRERGVVVLGIDIQDKDEAGRKFIRDFGLTFPNAPDRTGKVSVDYGVYGVPETFFIDRQGAIRVKHVSAVSERVFRETVEALLAEPAPSR